ncbi:hypothetical protein DS2_09192 [Catenovulum agarivorans DS-2]|uniref:ATPase involved in DNA repair n=1 Tax=Catenovulum agarivorans DS-2 TaxID=1328313 RepID=W7QBE3_9ALTE|nr:hypothetical protein [Catenovulum agarivorans]EWH10109.1 hypothetical protein DS2_09192 [Catenovulum agarivorans DS-2]
MDSNKQATQTKSELREQRLQELLNSCQEQVIQQIIGPFGLTPAMFDDKRGGNVTTQHNANQGIFAKESEEYSRVDYDYSQAKRDKMKEAVQNGTMNSQVFIDEYTGKTESTQRTTSTGKLGTNAELDHTKPVAEIHKGGGWMMDKDGRKAVASEKDNLHYTTMENNRKKSDLSAEDALSAENGYDPSVTQPIIDKANEAVEKHMPTAMERMQYHGKELAITGAKEASKNALRQALGVLLHEFVQGSFVELKQLMSHPNDQSLIERLISAFKRVAERVISKLKHALESALKGGVQGFVSNLLTFIINSVVTTSAKVVTIIRESMKGLWEALTLLVKPPKEQPYSEVCRQVTKIFAGIVTMGLGMMFEESIKGFIMSIPILTPIADVISLAVSGILTGITTALVIYGIDRFFDWLSSTGTELLQAKEAHLDELKNNFHQMANWIESQYQCSTEYRQIAAEYGMIERNLHRASEQSHQTLDSGSRMLESRAIAISNLEQEIEKHRSQQDELDRLMQAYFESKETDR